MRVLLMHVWLWISFSHVQQSSIEVFATPSDNEAQRRLWKPPKVVSDCWSQEKDSLVGMPPCGAHSSVVTHSDDSASGNAKVALLFLARNKIHTEGIWTAFFASAAELSLKRSVPPTAPLHHPILPTTYAASFCEARTSWDIAQLKQWKEEGQHAWDKEAEEWLEGPCGAGMTGREVYQQQDLFSVYLHRSPGAPAFPPDSLFHGRDINDRVFTAWGDISLVQALRNLLVTALADPRNSKFVLVSESCVPLRHPALFWAQHMAEAHLSRVGSERSDLNNPDLTRSFNEDLVAHGVLREGQEVEVYKASQWISLTRMHAQLAGTDSHLWPLFSKWCRGGKGDCEHFNYNDMLPRTCIADERYAATVLNFYNQTATIAPTAVTFTDWSDLGRNRGGAHPRTFWKHEAELALSMMLESRGGPTPDGCYTEQLLSAPTAAALFDRDDAVCAAAPSDSGLHSKNVKQACMKRMDAIKATFSAPPFNSMETQPQEPRIGELKAIMQRNLGKGGWLGGYRAMDPGCPLMGRKVHPDLVPSLLKVAWRCDGLGYAWECVASQEAARMAAQLAK